MGGGGGSVFYVSAHGHRYLQSDEMREEPGTPAIVESVRAGLVLQLKGAVGAQAIRSRERQLTAQALHCLAHIPNLRLLGSTRSERLPLFSFLVRHERTGLYLHANCMSFFLCIFWEILI